MPIAIHPVTLPPLTVDYRPGPPHGWPAPWRARIVRGSSFEPPTIAAYGNTCEAALANARILHELNLARMWGDVCQSDIDVPATIPIRGIGPGIKIDRTLDQGRTVLKVTPPADLVDVVGRWQRRNEQEPGTIEIDLIDLLSWLAVAQPQLLQTFALATPHRA